MKIELDLPEVPGYEYTGEYRSPLAGDMYYDDGPLLADSINKPRGPFLSKEYGSFY